jgi:hypothetical protein
MRLACSLAQASFATLILSAHSVNSKEIVFMFFRLTRYGFLRFPATVLSLE